MVALHTVQQKLKAPKGQYNKFGDYNYRSCEDIMEAVKPLLADVGAVLTVRDDLRIIGDRYYVMATAEFCVASEEEQPVTVTAYARECATKKGMDESQITGAASSYARKYALNGLFCIDDTKDADTKDNRETATKRAASKSNVDPRLAAARQTVIATAKELVTKGIAKSKIYEAIANNNNGKKSISTIPTVEDCERICKILKQIVE